jgi:hypothetical protein
MADGVYKIQFSDSPGQIVALLGSTDTGEKRVSFPGMPTTVNSSSEQTQWASPIFELIVALVFAAVSIPVLHRLLRDRSNKSLQPTAGHCDV